MPVQVTIRTPVSAESWDSARTSRPSMAAVGSTTVCPTCAGGTATATDAGGGSATHQWGFRTTSGGAIMGENPEPCSISVSTEPGEIALTCTFTARVSSASSAGSSRINKTWLRRESLRTTPVFGSTGYAVTGGPPRGTLESVIRTVVPDETRTHMRAAWREQLLALRSFLDRWIEADGRDGAAEGRERIEIR